MACQAGGSNLQLLACLCKQYGRSHYFCYGDLPLELGLDDVQAAVQDEKKTLKDFRVQTQHVGVVSDHFCWALVAHLRWF